MLFRLALLAHLTCAFGATAVFWIPIAAAKGGPLHLAAGRFYVRLIYLTALTGAPLAAGLLLRPMLPGARRTAAFLAYLIVILVMPVYHGVRVARAARTGTPVASPLHTCLCWLAIVAGVALFGAALVWREWPYVLLSPVGPVLGFRALAYSAHPSRLNFPGWARRSAPNRENSTGKEWQEEHIVAMVMSGIAVHTALLVFGISRTLHITLAGGAVYIPWLLPTIVGLPLLVWRVRRERARPSTIQPPPHTPRQP